MKKIYKWLILFLCLALAIASYSAGSVRAFGVFMVMGMLFELLFWLGLFKIKTHKISKNSTYKKDDEIQST